MLRITRENGSGRVTLLKLEGSMVAEWATLVERECGTLARSSRAVLLDLAAVRFVDLSGVEILARLGRGGVEILCPPGPVACLLEAAGIRVMADET